MRYIYYIILIGIVALGLAGYQILADRPLTGELAVKVNDHAITVAEYEELKSSHINCLKDKDEIVDSLITREILVQEARRLGIDQEEPFRQSIQDYYEQSLVKLLMDRKYAGLKIEVSEAEIDRYLELVGQEVEMTMFSFADVRAARENRPARTETISAQFEDLARELRNIATHHGIGEQSKPFRTEAGTYVAYRLDRLTPLKPPAAPAAISRPRVRAIIETCKKNEALNSWLTGLREKACVELCALPDQEPHPEPPANDRDREPGRRK